MDTGVRNTFEFQLFGLQRSGNHAFVAWICQQFDRPVLFLNNAGHFTDPYETWRYADIPNTIPLRRPRGGGNFAGIETLRLSAKNAVMYSYENLVLSRLVTKPLVPDHIAKIGASGARVRFLIVRDFYNWLASRIKLFEYRGFDIANTPNGITPHVVLWIAYAREYVGETDFLAGDRDAALKVNYVRWAKDTGYRSEILRCAGVAAKNNDIHVVPNVGGGSSFDSVSLSGRAASMQIDERWKYLDQDRWAGVLENVRPRKDLIDTLNAAIFGADANPPLRFFAEK